VQSTISSLQQLHWHSGY